MHLFPLGQKCPRKMAMYVCKNRKTLNNNDLKQVAGKRFSLKQCFAAGDHSNRLRKNSSAHCHLRTSQKIRSLCEMRSSDKNPSIFINFGWENPEGKLIWRLVVSDHFLDSIRLSPEGEVNSGGYILRREASRNISTALHRP